ncbi:hypothetical protein T440DRAFT_468594 [Plenodomus tracheiphilus IPT5]|uniref:Uncharacterized protein n=1 Tax=Plenodomus tracheiphilus IPT5 TaxID=1408161 RepID=A0A6A7B4M5_9PLEO|nr:hypothetical protein T440DRAFT_468594 [Plenodomus tracheiphilus IPT5]
MPTGLTSGDHRFSVVCVGGQLRQARPLLSSNEKKKPEVFNTSSAPSLRTPTGQRCIKLARTLPDNKLPGHVGAVKRAHWLKAIRTLSCLYEWLGLVRRCVLSMVRKTCESCPRQGVERNMSPATAFRMTARIPPHNTVLVAMVFECRAMNNPNETTSGVMLRNTSMEDGSLKVASGLSALTALNDLLSLSPDHGLANDSLRPFVNKSTYKAESIRLRGFKSSRGETDGMRRFHYPLQASTLSLVIGSIPSVCFQSRTIPPK